MEIYRGDFLPKEVVLKSVKNEVGTEIQNNITYPEVALIGIDILSKGEFTETEEIKTRTKILTQRLNKGANTIDTSLVGGYYAGFEKDEDGNDKFNPTKVEVNKWIKMAKYGEPNLHSEEAIDTTEQADFVSGCLGRYLTEKPNTEYIGRTIDVLATIKNTDGKEVINNFLDAFNASANKLTPEERVDLDNAVQGFGFTWNAEQKSYTGI